MILTVWKQLLKNGHEQKPGPLVNDVTSSKSSEQNIIAPKNMQLVKRPTFQSARNISPRPSYKCPHYQLIRDANLNLQLLASLLVGHELKLFIFTTLWCHEIVDSVCWVASPGSVTEVQIDQVALNLKSSRRNLVPPNLHPAFSNPREFRVWNEAGKPNFPPRTHRRLHGNRLIAMTYNWKHQGWGGHYRGQLGTQNPTWASLGVRNWHCSLKSQSTITKTTSRWGSGVSLHGLVVLGIWLLWTRILPQEGKNCFRIFIC